MSDRRPELIFSGKVASPGLAAGSIRLHARPKIDASPAGSPEEEAARLAAALEAAAARLQDLAADAAEKPPPFSNSRSPSSRMGS